MKFDNRTFRFLLLGLIGLCALVFIVIMFKGLGSLQKKSQDLTDLKLQSKVVNTQLASLQQAKKDIAQYGYFKDVAKTVIPNDKDQAKAILDISNFAAQSGFLIGGITFPTSDLGKASGSTPSSSPSTSQPASGSSSTKSADAASASAAKIITQAKPVNGIKGLYSIKFTITPQSNQNLPPSLQPNPDKLIKFLQLIESNRRTAQITDVVVNPQLDDTGQAFKTFSFSINVNIFMKP